MKFDAKLSDEQWIDDFYLSALVRKPAAEERRAALEQIAKSDHAAGRQDLAWAVLNSKEFLYQH